jgi:hypothetical protein
MHDIHRTEKIPRPVIVAKVHIKISKRHSTAQDDPVGLIDLISLTEGENINLMTGYLQPLFNQRDVVGHATRVGLVVIRQQAYSHPSLL